MGAVAGVLALAATATVITLTRDRPDTLRTAPTGAGERGPGSDPSAVPTSPAAGTATGSPATPTTTPSTSTARPSAGGVPAPGSLTGRTIVIDPGHNGRNYAHPEVINRKVDIITRTKACNTTGTETDDGYPEHAFNWDLANRLAEVLRAAGATVVLTRDSDTGVGPCLTERAAIGNRAHADLAISLHADGGPSTGRGFHVIMPGSIGPNATIVEPSARLGRAVRDAFRSGTGAPYADYIARNGLATRTDLGGLNLSTVPAVFLECGNMRNAADAGRLRSPAWRQRAARAIATGMAAYLAGAPAPGRGDDA